MQTKHLNLNFDHEACPTTSASAVRSVAEAEAEAKAKLGMTDLFQGGATQSQQNINANEICIGSEDLQHWCANEASQP